MNTAEFFEQHRKDIVELETILTSKVAMAPENGGDGELEKCKALEQWLSSHGITDLARYDAPDSRVSSGVRPNLVATIKGKSEKVLWVMAHLDVVPTGDLSLWETDPFTVVEKDGKLYGRGVEDDQQGLCSAVFAALYFTENKITPQYTIKLLFAADEEVGSTYGVTWLIENTKLFNKSDMILIPDGGDRDGSTIEIAEKNLLWLRVHVLGKQTHGSRPDTGANACLAACDLSLKLHGLEKVFNKKDSLFEPDYSTFQPTMRLKNVDGVNIIPGEDTFCMDCRILPCYSLKEILTQVDKLCAEVEKQYGVKVEYTVPQKSESPATSKDAPVVTLLANAIKKVHNIDAKCIGIGGGTVAAELRRQGIDAAVWSTLNDMAHQPNEYCIIDNLIKDALTLIEIMGV